MKVAGSLLAGIILMAIPSNAFTFDESLHSITTRGVDQKFVLTRSNQMPIASVILFTGSGGKLDLSSSMDSINFGHGKNNFLVRTRGQFAKHGFLVATVDTPSNKKKMSITWRMGEHHTNDISAVISFLKRQADVPVWVIGTSRGTFSAANMGIRQRSEVSGVVLTSSVTRSKPEWKIYSEYPRGVINMDLDKITAPVYVISHEDDQCHVSPALDIDDLAIKFTNSKNVEKHVFSGGDSPVSGSCQGLSQHGFLGIEPNVIEAIATFIKAN